MPSVRMKPSRMAIASVVFLVPTQVHRLLALDPPRGHRADRPVRRRRPADQSRPVTGSSFARIVRWPVAGPDHHRLAQCSVLFARRRAPGVVVGIPPRRATFVRFGKWIGGNLIPQRIPFLLCRLPAAFYRRHGKETKRSNRADGVAAAGHSGRKRPFENVGRGPAGESSE